VADNEVMEFESGPQGRARVPRRVFDRGTEPDPLYSLANERTYLSWLRLAITLMAAAVAIDRLFVAHPWFGDQVLSLGLVAISLLAGAVGVHRWYSAELALRLRRPLSGFAVPLLFTLAVALIGLGVVVLVLLPQP
jgi:putative membrane protein